MRRWILALVVVTAVYARYHHAWRQEDIRVEGVALGEELNTVRYRFPTLEDKGEEWRSECPHRGVYHSFEDWGLRAPDGTVQWVRGWHLQVGPYQFAPLQRGSFRRLESLLGPGRPLATGIYRWPQYHLQVTVDRADSVTMMTLE